MLVHPDQYLDARQPAWQSAEHAGLVLYDPLTLIVLVAEPAIEEALR